MSALDELAALNKASVAKARRMRDRRFRLILVWQDCLTLQDALDDYATHAGAGLAGRAASRLRSLQRKLHALTGEPMPPPRSVQRASLAKLVKKAR